MKKLALTLAAVAVAAGISLGGVSSASADTHFIKPCSVKCHNAPAGRF